MGGAAIPQLANISFQAAADADQMRQRVTMEKKPVRQADTLTLHLASGGGCAIRFVPAD